MLIEYLEELDRRDGQVERWWLDGSEISWVQGPKFSIHLFPIYLFRFLNCEVRHVT